MSIKKLITKHRQEELNGVCEFISKADSEEIGTILETLRTSFPVVVQKSDEDIVYKMDHVLHYEGVVILVIEPDRLR